jgi:transposase
MKYKEPTIGRGVRKLFKKAGFQTYLVDEFRTSCRCSKCKIGVCSKTMVRENPRPYRKGSVFVHGLIRCKNGCGFWNRDVNGATNIFRIAKDAIDGKGRPDYLSRNLQVA